MTTLSNPIVTSDRPTNASLTHRKLNAMPRGASHIMPAFIERAEGSELWDVDGRRYIDFATGIAVCNTGHRHPQVQSAVQKQLEQFSHTCIMVTPYAVAIELAERLNQLAPGPSAKKSMFFTTGAEAVENAVKIARARTRRPGVIAFVGGYHGRTLLTMGLNGKVAPYGTNFGPFPPSIHRALFPSTYRGVTTEMALDSLSLVFKTDLSPNDCAAIIVEPVQGEGGFYPAPNAFLQALRHICNRHGIVLIFDEVQSGFARTGRMFASMYAGVEPDLMTVAKGIAGGFPLSGVVGRADIMDAADPGGLGGTYAASPVGCAAALAVMDIIERQSLAERAVTIGAWFDERLRGLQAAFPSIIGDVRTSRGAMIAIELVKNGVPDQPDPELTRKIATQCHQRGLAVLTCGLDGNVFRFLPALTISQALVLEGLDIFEHSFRQATN